MTDEEASDLNRILDKATIERFWSNVDKSGGEDACWLWTLSLIPGGYGQFKLRDNKNINALRVALTIKLGRFPSIARHTCIGKKTA